MRLAVLGSGMIVADLLSVSAAIPGLKLAAIFGRSPDVPRLEQLAAQYGIPRVYTDSSSAWPTSRWTPSTSACPTACTPSTRGVRCWPASM